MSEEKKSKWEEVKVEIEQMTELLSRNLGRTRKLEFNCESYKNTLVKVSFARTF
jgi:CRISPR/Cas system CSM-associated protein Csm2 small subunit